MAWLSKLTNLFGGKKEEVSQEEEPSDKPRDHHYVFAHQMLPAIFHKNPGQFLDIATAPDGESRLRSAWWSLGEDMAKEHPGAALSASGLSQRTTAFGRRRAILVSFPPAITPPEGIFAALIEDGIGAQEARYIILERTFGDADDKQPIGVLCEWTGDGSRRNHQIVASPDIDAFLAAVNELLQREAERREAGADDIVPASWNPSEGDSPQDAVFSFTCRPQHCFFAFDALRLAAFRHIDLLVEAVASGTTQHVLEALWEQAGDYADLRDLPRHSHLGELSGRLVQQGQDHFLIVTLPNPIAYPEAFFVAIPLVSERQSGLMTPPEIYTLEMTAGSANERPYLGRLTPEGAHAVLGRVPGNSVEAFLPAIQSAWQGAELTDAGRYLMEHLVCYAKLAGQNDPKVTGSDGAVSNEGGAEPAQIPFPEGFGEVPGDLLRSSQTLLNYAKLMERFV